jgi:hypothetical protein
MYVTGKWGTDEVVTGAVVRKKAVIQPLHRVLGEKGRFHASKG